MQIVRSEIQRSGADIVVAFIDTQGIELGIDAILVEPVIPTVTQHGFIGQVIPTIIEEEDDDLDDGPEGLVLEIPPAIEDGGVLNLNNIYFCIDTFKKLTKNTPAVWDVLFRSANHFLAGLSEADSRKICLFYIDARRTIDSELTSATLEDVATHIGNKFYDLAIDIGLPWKLLYYVEQGSEIPIPDLSYAGTRAQDDPKLTFHREEYVCLVAISIICKLLCPIWGDLILRTVGGIDNTRKETYCLKVIEPILQVDVFRAVRHKLYHYISNIVNNTMSAAYSNAAFTASIGGFSTDLFHHIVFATIIVKRYVNVDLYTPEGNIMVWTSTCAKQSFNSLLHMLNKRCRIMPRMDISDQHDTGDDERNVSVLEYSSRVTAVTADVPMLIKIGTKMAIANLCQEYNIAALDFQTTVEYYRKSPIQVSSFNKTLVGILLGNRIGGAQGLKFLDVRDYIDLVAITQIYVAQQTGFESVVHLLTATTPDAAKAEGPSFIDNRINTTSKESSEYRRCEEYFPYQIDNMGVVSILRRVQEHVTKYHHFANTSPTVSAMMDLDALPNGSLVEYDETVMRNFCSVILDILTKEKHKAMGA